MKGVSRREGNEAWNKRGSSWEEGRENRSQENEDRKSRKERGERWRK